MIKENKNLSRSELISNFVITNPEYYIKEFKKIGSKPSYSFSFNLFASLLGPIWFGMRNIWNYALAFLIVETFAVVQIIRGLFPGGSITGAPKKRVMDLLYSLESEQSRGFYCGSTIILHESLLASSINIRSAEVFFEKRLLKYSSGSGLTLLSNALEEYEELKLKEQSFIKLLQG